MKRFEHYNARSIEEAVDLLNHYKGKSRVIAGGTDLLGALKDEVLPEHPEAVINIKTIDDLDYIRNDQKGITIGALAKLADIAKCSAVKEECKLLAEATHSVATPHIRNMATIGGNLAQDVRCWFYRYPRKIGGPIACLRKGGKVCSALAGDNRYHSIFGPARFAGVSSDSGRVRRGCYAVGPSDIAIALVALDAHIVTTARSLSAETFFTATATNSTVLAGDELIKEIQVPKPPASARQRYDKFTLRKPIDFAVVSVASILTIENETCKDARIVLGAVAPGPLRAREAEEVLNGRIVDETIAIQAAQAALSSAKPLKMNDYKMEIAKALVKRAVLS